MLNPTENPYAFGASSFSAPALDTRGNLVLTIVGTFLGGLAACGAAARLLSIVFVDHAHFVTQDAKIANATALLGLLIFAVTACWLLLVMARYSTVAANTLIADHQVVAGQGFVVIATAAMLMRVCSEPTSDWTPDWTSYCLTTAAGICMLMVFARLRIQNAGELNADKPRAKTP